jgi:streptogramin lyase
MERPVADATGIRHAPSMIRRSRRKVVIFSLVFALAATLAGLWLIARYSTPAPTPFGWAAELGIVAGNGVKGHADGVGPAASFSDPFALAMDASGTLYVADAGETNRIRKIDTDGRTSTLPGQFDTPSGLAFDKAGNLIVADTGANAIRKLSLDGTLTTIAGDGTAGFRDGPANRARFNGPIGVAVAEDGTIFVADSYNDRIRAIDPNGVVTTLAGGPSSGFRDAHGSAAAFDTPCGVIIGRDGALLVADTGNDAIRRVTRKGRVTTLALTMADDRNGPLKEPIGLAQSWDGFVYIASYRRGRIVQMAPSGALRVLTGADAAVPGNDALHLSSPAGLALDDQGALYVADASTYAVRKLSPRKASSIALSMRHVAAPSFIHAKAFPWPVTPQNAWHEVVGGLGEVRGNYQGESRDHLHAGLDIRAGVGEAVLAIAAEKVADPLPNGSFGRLSEGLRIDAMTYIHMRVGRSAAGEPIDPARFRLLRDAAGAVTGVRVKRGTRFAVGDRLGTVNSMAHVHLELGPPGGKINAMALPFTGFTDSVAPRVEAVEIRDGAGHALTERQDGRLLVTADKGPLDIIVDAWDQVDGNAPYRRLGLYRLGFQILHADGSPVPGFERPRINLLFDRMPLGPDAVTTVYAPGSGVSVHSGRPTRFLYVVSNQLSGGHAQIGGWNPGELSAGDYIIRAAASDRAGNMAQGARDLPIRVR